MEYANEIMQTCVRSSKDKNFPDRKRAHSKHTAR